MKYNKETKKLEGSDFVINLIWVVISTIEVIMER
jgi:hypothetical protein